MKFISKLFILQLYIALAQIYPIVHLQMHACQEDAMVALINHPPDTPFDELEPTHRHCQTQGHGHEKIHCFGDPDYVLQVKVTIANPFFHTIIFITEKQNSIYVAGDWDCYSPQIKAAWFYSGIQPDRSPPYFS